MIQIIHTPMLAKMRQTFGGKRVTKNPLGFEYKRTPAEVLADQYGVAVNKRL
jgi:hypothetical protein